VQLTESLRARAVNSKVVSATRDVLQHFLVQKGLMHSIGGNPCGCSHPTFHSTYQSDDTPFIVAITGIVSFVIHQNL